MSNIEVIREAKRRLTHPVDAAHGIEHHRAVASNCQQIIAAEGLQVDTEALLIAAWWHDVESLRGKTLELRTVLEKSGITRERTDLICSIVEEHTFGRSPEIDEERILYDADKIEYFNPERMRQALADAQSGVLPVSALRTHYTAWQERHMKVLESFYFTYSRRVVERNLPELFTEIARIGRFLESAV